ncbi:helix-turn-helix domain-containing protein [Aureitalea marina]|uniref:HTH cro/C1-type domain-containing protein n=1 Tax=Aureitalea marina TaxID=930804 RepID=A0A2S7KPA4_9FLAO|nr:helix-turn-helix transcriptional regulator [Aureitalea marina]PQB04464.1 hypothetical protein BST85_05780 [Aureitalea marina]
MVNSQDFAKRLHIILDYYQLSATSLADKLEVNRSTISHLLSGRNKPSLDFVMKLLSHFPEVDLYWLMNGTGKFPAEKNEAIRSTDSISMDMTPTESEGNKYHQKKEGLISDSQIERIVIFFKDGSFKAYDRD